MQAISGRILRYYHRVCGAAAVLLTMGPLSTAAAPQKDAKPPASKDQARPAQDRNALPKNDPPNTAPVKLGLSINDPRALQGFTLISPFVSPDTYLLDMQGRVVRTWHTDFSPGLSAFLLENGHLMRPASIGGDARVFGPGPGIGGRVQEFTWDGELVWDFKFYGPRQLPHHDMIRLPNGHILMIVWDRKTAEEAIAAGRRPEMTGDKHLLPDSLVEIKPTGKTTGEVVWEWHLWDHLVQDFDKTKANYGNIAEHAELVNINFGEDELPSARSSKNKKDDGKNRPPQIHTELTHFNAVAYNVDLDQIAVSVYRFNEFWIIDHSTTTAEAASHHGGKSGKGGDLLYRWGNPLAYRAGTKADRKLFNQHNVHWIPKGLPGAGHILLFNNGGDRTDGSYSSVDELVPPADSLGRYPLQSGKPCGPDGPLWSYTASKKDDFFSSYISGAQRLANGNTLICSGANGTLFEVTPSKEIVWKYVNPVKAGKTFGPRQRLGQIVSPIAGDLLGVSTEQRTRVEEIQKDIDAHLDKLLTADQKMKSMEWPRDADGDQFGPPSPPGRVMNSAEQNRLKFTDEQKKDLVALQKAVDARFDRLLTETQRRQIKTVFEQPGSPPAALPFGEAGRILSSAQQDALKLSPEQRKRLEEIQKDVDSKVETLLTDEQKKQLMAMRQGAPGGRGGPGDSPPGGTPLFRAYRYAIDHPSLAGRSLTPGKLLEELQQKDIEKNVADSKKDPPRSSGRNR